MARNPRNCSELTGPPMRRYTPACFDFNAAGGATPTPGKLWKSAKRSDARRADRCSPIKEDDRVTASWHRYRTACPTILVLTLGACATNPVNQGQPAQTPQSTEHPMLVAARAGEISLFGDLGQSEQPSYFTRSAMSLRQHTFAEIGSDTDPDVDPEGQRVVFASTRHNRNPDLYIKSIDGLAVTQLTSDPGSDVQPAFSPDGKLVAFASNRAGNWDIWIISVDGGQPAQITAGDGDEVHPSWSPDGSQLVYSRLSGRQGQWELWIVDAIAGGSQMFIGYGLFPEWSPTGPKIAYQRARERGTRWFSIWTLTLVDGEPRHPTELAASAHQAMILPNWSPDGRQISYAATPTIPSDGPVASIDRATFDIWVMGVDGRGKVRLTDGYSTNYAPAFSKGGRVFFTSSRAGVENIWSQRPAGPVTPQMGGESLTSAPAPTDSVRDGQMAPGHAMPARTVSERNSAGTGWKSEVSDKRPSPN